MGTSCSYNTEIISCYYYDFRLVDGRIWKRNVNQMIDCGLVGDKEVSTDTDQNVNLEQK